MSTKDNGGPAFPVEAGIICKGMTLRDYFAAKAMVAVLISPMFHENMDIAAAAYEVADAMLEARHE